MRATLWLRVKDLKHSVRTERVARVQQKPIVPWLWSRADLTVRGLHDLHGRRGRDPVASARYESG